MLEILIGYSEIAAEDDSRSVNNTSTEWYGRHHGYIQKSQTVNYRSLKECNSMNWVKLVLGITSEERTGRLY